MRPRLEVEEVIALAWIAAQTLPDLRPETIARVVTRTLEKAGYKIVPIEPTEAGDAEKADRRERR